MAPVQLSELASGLDWEALMAAEPALEPEIRTIKASPRSKIDTPVNVITNITAFQAATKPIDASVSSERSLGIPDSKIKDEAAVMERRILECLDRLAAQIIAMEKAHSLLESQSQGLMNAVGSNVWTMNPEGRFLRLLAAYENLTLDETTALRERNVPKIEAIHTQKTEAFAALEETQRGPDLARIAESVTTRFEKLIALEKANATRAATILTHMHSLRQNLVAAAERLRILRHDCGAQTPQYGPENFCAQE